MDVPFSGIPVRAGDNTLCLEEIFSESAKEIREEVKLMDFSLAGLFKQFKANPTIQSIENESEE